MGHTSTRGAGRGMLAAAAVGAVLMCMPYTAEGFSASLGSPLAALRAAQGVSRAAAAGGRLGAALPTGRVAPMGLRMAEGEGERVTGWELWSRPRTTNANWGVFFEIATKDRDVWVTGIRAGGHSFATHDDYTRMKIRVFTTEGTAVGKEKDAGAWELIGEESDFKLPRVEVGDSMAEYHTIPFKLTHIPANSVRSFCVHTDQQRGLALRRKLNFDTRYDSDPNFKEWVDGVTDEGLHFNLVSGLVPGEKLFEEVSEANNARAFVGVIEYDLVEPK